jgi:DNA ligase (NAD+)
MLDIIQSIGRTGKVTYVAKLSPVNICGTIVSSATLHNAEYIKENDIRIGDIVKVFKAGEIIPKVIGPVLSERKNDLAVFTPISKCPFCGSLLEKQNNEIDQYCTNIACPERIIFSLVHFCSKECFDISDLSEKNIKKLYEKKIINKIQDLYCLDEKKDLIIKNDFKIKEKMFNKIWQSIQNSKNKSLEKLLFSIGIRHIGEATSRVLAEHFRNMDNLINANFEELSNLNDIGETVANSIINFFHNSDNLELINELKKNNVNMNYISNVDESILEKESIYYRKNVVVTGSFELSRYEIKNILKSKYDVNISENVTKNTNFLIVGENPGTKLEKANKLKIKIVTEKI